ncbi:hypothetical protein PSQ19_05455 [Devosia algicola]|uniref:Uncharacterized protein n=1 Tax=Devosia algicola TaxID=3026418 RepID=A0ABY7YQY9_9HYPH|nr:hypothetical protein [Devosia algicola]WDR03538.1 hypothetical protein PSQ19_05455 [Devosia algicola]
MASMLSWRPKVFRTRNPDRDANTDMDRMMTVRRAIEDAIVSARRERQGLQQRLDVSYAQASNLLDNSGDYGARSSEDEQSILDAEANAAAAKRRIGQIDLQINGLSEVLSEFDGVLSRTSA